MAVSVRINGFDFDYHGDLRVGNRDAIVISNTSPT